MGGDAPPPSRTMPWPLALLAATAAAATAAATDPLTHADPTPTQPIGTVSPLDYDPVIRTVVLALYCLVAVVTVIFLVFYVPHISGHLVARAVTLYARRRYNAELQLGALKISPLGGRILFRRLRWITPDYSIYVEGGYVGFRWWRLETRELHDVRIDPDLPLPRSPAAAVAVDLKTSLDTGPSTSSIFGGAAPNDASDVVPVRTCPLPSDTCARSAQRSS